MITSVTNPLQPRPKQDGRHTPNLWPVWLVAPGALLLVGAAALGLYHGAELLLASETTGRTPVKVQDVISTTVTVLTLIGAVLAALYAYRKQLLDEGTSHRADSTQLTERYAKAAEQLGHEQAAVRLAGVYAMARLADDWPEQRQVCVDVLCAYLRMPYETDPAGPGFRHGEREVRLTIIRTIRSHLQDPSAVTTWCGLDLAFTGATFDGGDFSGSTFTGGRIDFFGSTFCGGRIDFSRSTFSGGEVFFRGSTFSAAEIDFTGSTYSGGRVDFSCSTFAGGEAHFSRSTYSGGGVGFTGSTFSGGRVYFESSTYSGGHVHFSHSTYSGGHISFERSKFTGGEVSFSASMFSGSNVSFADCTYDSGWVFFSDSTLSAGQVRFDRSKFRGGEVSFASLQFTGSHVSFAASTYQGGEISFYESDVHPAATIQWGPFRVIPVNHP